MRSLLSLACLLALAGCAGIGSNGGDMRFQPGFFDRYRGPVAPVNVPSSSERRAISAAPGLEVMGNITVDVKVGPTPMLEVSGDTTMLSLVHTEMAGDTLKIWPDKNMMGEMRVRVTTPQVMRINVGGDARLSVSDLNGAQLTVVKDGSGAMHLSGRVTNLDMQVAGSGNVNATALHTGNASVNLNGSGHLSLGQVRGEALTANVRGNGAFQASGAVQSVNASVYGMGGANLVGLSTQQATLSSHGAGDISASVNQSLIAQTNGEGYITVYGSPTHKALTGKHIQVLN
jgi:hypothetical protein